MYIVYSIEFKGQVIYIGRTNNLKRRQQEHNRAIKNGKGKEVHIYCIDNGLESIILIPLKEFKSKVDAKRYEMFLILTDYFGGRCLKQKVPQIKDF